jgi:3-oxoacyl-ACP reductase-like protein
MSIFGMIKDAIWGKAAANAAPTPVAAEATAAAPAASAAPAVTAAAPLQIDVTALLDEIASHHSEKLNWRTSIVDLMKLIGLDSSLANRKELADELGYPGEKDGSAEMNIWLHKQVMKKLAENGGTIPEELTH